MSTIKTKTNKVTASIQKPDAESVRIQYALNKLAEIETAEKKEIERINKVKALLVLAFNNQLNNENKIELGKIVKYSDLENRILYCRKGGVDLKVQFTDNSVIFTNKKGEVTAKRLPLNILASFGSCENYLIINKFSISDAKVESRIFSKFRASLATEISLSESTESINENKQLFKVSANIYNMALKMADKAYLRAEKLAAKVDSEKKAKVSKKVSK